MTEHNEKKQVFENNDDFEKQNEYVNADSDKCRDELTGKSIEILKECFDAQITKQLKENPPEIPTYEQFSAMIDKDRTARRRRKRRITGIAACFVAAVLIGVFAFGLPGSDVDADNNPKEEITTEDGVIIEDGGWGSSEYDDNVWKTDDWKHVEDAKKLFPSILIPEYIPEGYKFESLTVEIFETKAVMSEYVFKESEDRYLEVEIMTLDGGETATAIMEAGSGTKRIKSLKGNIYITEGLENKIATIQNDDGLSVCIISTISDKEIVKLVEGLND